MNGCRRIHSCHISQIQELVTNAKAAAAARVTYLEAVATNRTAHAAQRQFLADLTQTLLARFSSSPTTLADFDLAPHARTEASRETKVAAAAKGKATRQARGTKGSKQLAAVQGDVTGIVVKPVKAGASVASSTVAAAEAPAAGVGAPAPVATVAPKV